MPGPWGSSDDAAAAGRNLTHSSEGSDASGVSGEDRRTTSENLVKAMDIFQLHVSGLVLVMLCI